MHRRESLYCLLALGAAAFPAMAQSAAQPARILIVVFGKRPDPIPPRSVYGLAFVEGMRALGYAEGRSYVLEVGWTLAKAEDLPVLASEFAVFKPDVILATGEISARAARQVTATIPIVLCYSGDPVAAGFAQSLARPGGNITGVATLNEDLSGKMLEMLLLAVPGSKRVGVLANPDAPSYASVLSNLRKAVGRAGASLLSVEARSEAEVEAGFLRMAREKIAGVVVLGDPLIFQQRRQIADLALKHRMASVYPAKEHVEAGGLLSYGVNIVDGFRRAASFVDRILKGAKPGDLPIEQATTLELVINLKTAKALGITIPQSVLVRADRVIE